MSRICCLVFARLASTRVPNKLLQEVGGRTLLDRGLDYLVRLREACPNVTPIVCCPPDDAAIIDACNAAGVETLPDTVQASCWPELVAPHVDMLQSRFDWVWDANVFCHPFLRVETGLAVIENMREDEGPFTVTHSKRGILWSDSHEAILGKHELANTKSNPIYHQLAHIAYCWPSVCLGMSEIDLSKLVYPVALPLHWSELIDIDTPEDLEHARAVADCIDRQPIYKRPEPVDFV